MFNVLSFLLCVVVLLIHPGITSAQSDVNFDSLMDDWTDKKSLASEYLLEAENAFKIGDELNGCALQQKASGYGIEATKSLMKAMELHGTVDGRIQPTG